MIITKTPPSGSENLIKEISGRCGVSTAFAKLLVTRGIKSAEEAEKFIRPDKKYLHDPYLFSGMKAVTERIKAAKENGETVVIYGDYDADGITATAIMYRGLKVFGIDAYAVVPERENGYGLTEGVLERVLEEYCPDLIITVDCGISSYAEIEELKDLGVDVIVTDHHEIPEQIPDCTVVNCKLGDGYPFDGLCGAGVAYKVISALVGEEADNFLDLVAVATIADSMPLTDENRILVSEGLKLIKSGRCSKVIRAICESGGAKELVASSLAYTVAPRVNAAGRMGDAYSALVAFTSEDNFEIKILADKLNSYNAARQTECDVLYKAAKEKLRTKSPLSRIIVLYDKGWKSGIIGIVAAKLMEEYSKPVILFSEKDGVLHGSARSLGDINIFKSLTAVQDVLEAFGGHAQAAGVTIKKENIGVFEEKINEYIAKTYDATAFAKDIEVDGFITGKFKAELARELELFEPCGVDNRRPVFALNVTEANASPLKYGSPHVSFSTPYIDLLYFNGYDSLALLNSANEKTVVFEPRLSTFNDRESLKGIVKSVSAVIGDGEDVKFSLYRNQLSNADELETYEKIDTAQAQKFIDEATKEIYGTVFVVNNPDSLKKYKRLETFDREYLKKTCKGNLNVLCYGISTVDFDEYERVVFLDKPLYMPIIGIKTYVNTELSGFDAEGLKTDRDALVGAYLELKNIAGGFTDVKEACEKCGEKNAKQLALAVKVFEELGLLVQKNGKYLVVGGKKCDINSSVILNRVKDYIK
ncbi:MAG: single-stranded-DNA-specific exonuclease RecJ [Candidatus Borkfalkiaceae bacterium]|nr:single-stranded-DNA-specific exonuclease RecJ [Christensenellaceae bacterium]